MGGPYSLPAYAPDPKVTEQSSLVYTCQEAGTKHIGGENGICRKVSRRPSSPRKGMVQRAQRSQTDPWVALETKAGPSLPSQTEKPWKDGGHAPG